MKDTVIGMDIAKNVFQLHVVDPNTGKIARVKLKRAEVAVYFANRQAAVVAIEACGGAHYWAGVLQRLGTWSSCWRRPRCDRSCCATRTMRPMPVRSGRRCSSLARGWLGQVARTADCAGAASAARAADEVPAHCRATPFAG